MSGDDELYEALVVGTAITAARTASVMSSSGFRVELIRPSSRVLRLMLLVLSMCMELPCRRVTRLITLQRRRSSCEELGH